MNAGKACDACSAPIQEGQIFCGRCGMIVEGETESSSDVPCETHPERRAVGLCCICNRPLCSDCRVRSEGKILCAVPEHQQILHDWCVLYQSESEFEADAMMRNLADGGIEAHMFSLHDHIATHWLNEECIRVWVRRTAHEQAQALLIDLHLIGNDGAVDT